ncbi:DUF1573 domain-containing protein [Planctomycetes bacterium K23_9]|uniref:DUF1573 domain-containing protein n=1 Tax=Stieleria marina TaxID=1930275 RepID=A0A517NVR0_9BACT|nr:hypothetical protein K239x_32080 [Planctomycetes bacterium K23_9]
MKHFWLLLTLCGGVGLSAAWALNQAKYGHRDAYLDRLNLKDVTADNVIELVKADQKSSGARVELLSEESHHFGSMAPGDEGEHTFRIKNVGTEPLSLKEGASTCKCTIGTLNQNTLAPGEETEIVVSWTVKTQKKDFSQKAQVITNDPHKVVLDFVIQGDVVRDIEFAPRAIQFGEVAAGEPFEVEAQMYSFYDNEIEISEVKFLSEQMNKLSKFDVEPFDPTVGEGEFSKATRGYNIKARVRSGLSQGAVATRMQVVFHVRDNQGEFVKEDESRVPVSFLSDVETTGFIAGQLSMVESTKIKSRQGAYVIELGALEDDDSKKARGFIKLKGSERDNTNLSIGEVEPAEAIQAKLGKPIKQESTVLYPLELEIIPGDKPFDLRGKSKGDYGTIWIETDNPKVPRMLIGVKFSIDAKQ